MLLTDHARLHDLMMAVLGRLVDYAGLFECDLYFTTLALMHEAGQQPGAIFKDKGVRLLDEGRILAALNERLNQPADGGAIFDRLENLFNLSNTRGLRNRFAHFNMLRGNTPVDLTGEVNKARRLMAYDRKLKNAVAKSIKDLLAREGLDLCWSMGGDHTLRNAQIATRQATHLGKKDIKEDLHGEAYVAMAAALFAGQAVGPGDENKGKGAKRHSPRKRRRSR